jgi:hypothetical protein
MIDDAKRHAYKMTSDSNCAPCVHNGVLTIAVCKPHVRQEAPEGSWVYGFAAPKLGGHLVYVAQVARRVEGGAYYRDAEFEGRPDRIYQWTGERFVRRDGASPGMHDTHEDLVHDLGEHPNYDRTDVLLSTDFRYLGGSGTTAYGRDFPALAPPWLHDLNRDYEVNHSAEVQDALRRLQAQLWAAYPDQKVIGKPTQLPEAGGECGCLNEDDDGGCGPRKGRRPPPAASTPKGGCPPPRRGGC